MMMMMEEPACYETSAPGDNLCWTFSQKGSCPRGDRCRWEHRQVGQDNCDDPVCRAWQLWGECPRGNDCQWVHPQQQEAMWANQCVQLPMNAMPIIGIVQGPVEWMSYCYDGSEGSPMSAPSPGGFDSGAFFQQCRSLEATQMDELDQLDGTRTPSVIGEEALGTRPRIAEATLEEMSRSGSADSWDQFEANERMYGVTTTFNEDLSQYSTPLKLSKIPARVQDEADRIASEIQEEHKLAGRSHDDYRNCEDESTDDEENRFSAVCRESSMEQPWPQAPAVRA
jgi:hypothetical protein